MKTTLTALALLALTAPLASAHATLDVKEIAQNSYQRVALRVPHGCDGEATLRVRLSIPEGVVGVKPMPKAGWTLTTVKGPITPYTSHGNTISEGVKEVMWEGELSDEHYDEFVFQGRFTDALPEGMLAVPVVQECATGFQRWIEVPAEGQDAHSLPFPAPRVKIVPAAQKH
ncbi:MAG: YcnI family protein [Pseudorhodobacter sp.]